jgi:ABC-2 type transport system ATP-binding protein
MTTPAFSLRSVTKSYGDDFTLGPLDLELEAGQVLAFVGPNGAGKTTTMNCLAGLLTPDAGEVAVFDHSVVSGPGEATSGASWKQDVGYVGETSGFYRRWTATQNLRALERFFPRWSSSRAEQLAKRFALPLGKKVKDLSRGNKTKLSLVAALARGPRLLLLDEPTAGLDPVVRSEVLDVLWEFLEDGERAIFYSTHILSDISRLADDLAFLKDGQLLRRGSKEQLTDEWRKITFRLEGHEGVRFPEAYEYRRNAAEHQLLTHDYEATLRRLTEIKALDIQHSRLPIDEIAVAILKEKADVVAG